MKGNSRDVGAGGGGGKRRQCDYCGEAAASLHCRADAARLCVACDRHVHGANALSRKHVRAPLCSSCLSRPSSTRLTTITTDHHSFYCADCEVAAGSGVRIAVEVFSGCPSAAELAASWGLDLSDGGGEVNCDGDDDPFLAAFDYAGLGVDPDFHDLYVPCHPPLNGPGSGNFGGQRKLKGEGLHQQLAEMARSEVTRGSSNDDYSGHSDLRPSTPCRGDGGHVAREEHVAVTAQQAAVTAGSLAFTSLLTMPAGLVGGDRIMEEEEEEEVMWDSAAVVAVAAPTPAGFNDPPTQVLGLSLVKKKIGSK